MSVAGVVTLGLPERGRGAVEPVSWWSLMILETVLFAKPRTRAISRCDLVVWVLSAMIRPQTASVS